MQKLVFAIDEVLYSLPQPMTNAVFVRQQASRHYCHPNAICFDFCPIFFATFLVA